MGRKIQTRLHYFNDESTFLDNILFTEKEMRAGYLGHGVKAKGTTSKVNNIESRFVIYNICIFASSSSYRYLLFVIRIETNFNLFVYNVFYIHV